MSAIPEIPVATDSDVFITRAFAAPREVVWRFLTDPEYLARWFGPQGVHVEPASIHIDLRVGGSWDLDMVDDATGAHYPLRTILTAVIPPEYLEGSASADAAEGRIESVTLRIWLHDHGDKTRLTLHQGPFAPEFRTATTDGWMQSFVKIDDMLDCLARTEKES